MRHVSLYNSIETPSHTAEHMPQFNTKFSNLSNVARYILYHTTWWRRGALLFVWPRCNRLEEVKTTDKTRREKVIVWQFCLSPQWDFHRHWPRIAYNKYRKQLGNEEWGRGMETAQNGQGSLLFGDVAGQPKHTCYTQGISHSEQADDHHGIHFGHRRDRQSILVTLSKWWCGCIQIVRKISIVTSFPCKGPP